MSPPSVPRPFLKWVGGKRQLLPQLRPFFPAAIARYHEPFLGSGAVFFDLCADGRLDAAHARLSDDNADLIGTYLRLRDSTADLVKRLGRLARAHAARGREQYYDVRDRQFNPGRERWLAAGGTAATYPVSLAAMLLYLNRTGYNGLFRLNASGEFNVPVGRYSKPNIVDGERLSQAAEVLAAATIVHAPFDTALRHVRGGDFVYLDPPYAPLTSTANFRSYTARGFTPGDQEQLRDEVVKVARRGAYVLLSNSTSPQVVDLYDHLSVRDAGLRCVRVTARRAINTRADRRGPVEELVVTNLGDARRR